MAASKKRKRKRKISKKVARRKKSKTKAKPKKKIRKWDTVKLNGLAKNLFSKIKQEYWDYDYIEQLSDKEKAWLNEFVLEYLGANLDNKSNPERRIFHNKKKAWRKNCFDMNNSRNRDILSVMRAQGLIDYGYGSDIDEENSPTWFSEDDMLDYIDKKRSGELK